MKQSPLIEGGGFGWGLERKGGGMSVILKICISIPLRIALVLFLQMSGCPLLSFKPSESMTQKHEVIVSELGTILPVEGDKARDFSLEEKLLNLSLSDTFQKE